MTTRLAVCQGPNCREQCSHGLLRDIEEFCSFLGTAVDAPKIEATSCLSHCGQGPNVEVKTGDGEATVETGIKTFKAMEKLIIDSVEGAGLSGTRRKVALLKFRARREKNAEASMEKVEEAFGLLGGGEVAVKKDARLTSQLMVLRAKNILSSQANAALTDAEAAVKLAPTWPQAHLMLADVLAKLRRFSEGAAAVSTALDLTQCAFEKRAVKKQLAALRAKAEGARAEGGPPEAGGGKAPGSEEAGSREAAAAGMGGGGGGTKASNFDLTQWGEAGIVSKKVEGDASQSLYSRLGGEEQLEILVFGVYDLMRVHPELGPIFEKFARSPQTFQRLKVRTVDYLGGEWGGPAYIGPNLWESHVSMAIDNFFYDGMMACYREMLRKMGADPQIAAEVVASVEAMRKPIVDPDGSYVREMEERLAAATAARQERMRKYKKEQEEKKKREQEAATQGRRGSVSQEKEKKKGAPEKKKKDAPREKEAKVAEQGAADPPNAEAKTLAQASPNEGGATLDEIRKEAEPEAHEARPHYIKCRPVVVSL